MLIESDKLDSFKKFKDISKNQHGDDNTQTTKAEYFYKEREILIQISKFHSSIGIISLCKY